MAEKSVLQAGMPRLALKGAVGPSKTIAAHSLMSAQDVQREGKPSQSGIPAVAVASQKPAWDVYGGMPSSGLVAFTK
jgi:hypothetical protein